LEKLQDLARDFEDAGMHLGVQGLEAHKQLSDHALAARKRPMTQLRRLTVIVDEELARQLSSRFIELGASGYTSIPCSGSGRDTPAEGDGSHDPLVRLETIMPNDVAEWVLDYLRTDIAPQQRMTVCLKAVDVLRQAHF
jgi:Nitrogen regulatory protein P-II